MRTAWTPTVQAVFSLARIIHELSIAKPMTPEISILLPVRDCEEYIQEALESVARQSFTRWECLLLDDGSTDSTGAILSRFAETDERIKLHRVEKSLGLPAGLNLLLNKAAKETTREPRGSPLGESAAEAR